MRPHRTCASHHSRSSIHLPLGHCVCLSHLSSRSRNLIHMRLALEPLLRRENCRRNPGTKLGGRNHCHGSAQGAAQALASSGSGRVAQRQRKGNEATKVQDGVEPLHAHGRQPVRHDHSPLSHRDFEVYYRDEGYAWRKDEKLECAGARSMGDVGVPIVDYSKV